MMAGALRGLLALAVLASLSCASDNPPPFPEGTLAAYDGGTVTLAEVDARVLELGAARPAPGTDLDQWYDSFVRGLVLERLLREEPGFAAVRTSAEGFALAAETRRSAVYRLFLERLPPIAAPTEEEIRREFESNEEDYRQGARRRVWHIFLRAGEDRSLEQVEGELEAIRQRLLAGESFGLLASEVSESETRHREGLMGWLEADQLGRLAPPIFALALNEPSEPFLTPDGGHLFYVDGAVEGRRYELHEIEPAVVTRLQTRRRASVIDEAITALPPPEGPSFRPDAQELQSLLTGGDPDTVVLRVGDYQLDLRGLRRMLEASETTESPLQRATKLLAHLDGRERVYLHAQSQGWLDETEAGSRVSAAEERELLRLYLERKLEERVSADDTLVTTYYEARRRRFTEPLRLELRELRLPLEPDSANRHMRRLEAAVWEVTAGTASLEALRGELGGEVHELGWVTLEQLAAFHPTAAARATALEGAGCLPPFRRETTLHLLEVTERREPTERPLAEVKALVEKAYLEENREELSRAVRDELLARGGFRLLVDDLGAVVGAAARAD